MKSTSMVIITLLVLAVGGIGVYALMNRNVTMTKSDSTEKSETMVKDDKAEMIKTDEVAMQKDKPTVANPNETMMKKEGRYVPFSPEALTSSTNSRRILFFFANWCPICKPADASFTKNVAEIPADVTLIRVNYNDTETDQTEKELAKKYGITYQHTFVQIDAKGNEVTKWNGGQIDELLSNLK